ncbi:MAG: MBL fold metallo-hydrolase [[Clostridium] innocuum]
MPPNRCFDGKQLMMEDNLQLLYTPGHTLDGISVYDQMQEALFVGDTLEKPLVQLEEASLPEYKQTLEYFLTLPAVHFYAGHTLHLTKADMIDTLAYINALLANKAIQFDSEEIQHIHTMNQNAIKR